jgi:two-component system response regulator PilR (NtrC family)
MKMPGMDGMQVLKELQKTKPQTMVIIITAFASEEMAAEAIKLGAYEYITKPINLEDFNHMVRNALERFQLVEKNQ